MATSADKPRSGSAAAEPVEQAPRGRGRRRRIWPRRPDIGAVIVIGAVVAIILMIALA